MDREKCEDRRRIGSVKAAVNMYGDMILDENSSLKKPQEGFPEPSPRVKEFHRARRSLNRYKESRKTAESELFGSRGTVNDPASMAEESNLEAKRNAFVAKSRSVESYQYEEVMRELELVKQDLSQLKLDMASVMEEKARAKKEFEDSNSRMKSNGASVEALKEHIEAAKEEHVLVELAQIEAQKEAGEIEAQKEKEAGEFSFWIEETKKKREDMIEEIDHSKELEKKLGATLSDISLLQDELKQVKGLDSVVPRGDEDGLKQQDDSFHSVEKVEPSAFLESIKKELEAAKKELDSIKDEGFQYMSSMDIIRNELQHVKEETSKLKKTEEKADSKVKSLNTKLVRAKSKLEAVTAAEEKAKSIETNLSLTLEQSRAEADASKKEKMLITDDIATIKAEIQKTESEIDITEERLQAAMQELEAVKSSEALALEKLRSLIETTMQSRASASNHSSTMTVSRFEYEYLTGHAVGAEEIADKKVAAAQAWIEALKASEREILMKTETAHRELRELRVEEENDVSLSAKENVDSPNGQLPLIRVRSMKSNGNSTPSRRAKHRKSASPAIQESGSTSFTIKTKRKSMPNLTTFLNGKKVDKDE
ncbi:plastid movement impaired 2, WEAK CHLOROPLAST MOVEMENT UNDER BLUE LIGHT 2 [Hibiscus trionum]|uniref:Plastid movement impaired 2, WEAK CHLOROPLAST MOVEMENT UNDER BLUE LIGHT 2 n=1 Tax=Hibiscus trionum TaxID=183268 RepID=A0A9W7J4J7_HIBTR|nr:plastid movement impaired 2, WEAK CHLOROPLAST MOVEMENT UNDER BLUE LIGHT 2 [Hibiscus trionum]